MSDSDEGIEDSSPPSASSPFSAYDVVHTLMNTAVHLFFRDVQTRNSAYVPASGPIIFVCAPHANQFVDPMMIMTQVPRHIGFLAAKVSVDRPLVGFLIRAVESIPVVRAQDLAKPASGRITLQDRVHEPTRILGFDTRFTLEAQAGMSILLPKNKGAAVIKEIVNDSTLILERGFKDLEALEWITQEQGCPFKIAPHVDQSQVYEAVHQRLLHGGCVGIFPEGGSHDRAEMLPLKAGVTVMALGAVAAHPHLKLKIIPVGLNYFHPDKFRSRAVIEFGKPIKMDPQWVAGFKQGGDQKREACARLLDVIHSRLREVTVNCPDYETLMFLQAARRLYRFPEPPQGKKYQKLDPARALRLTRRLVEGYTHYKDDERVIELRNRLLEYNRQLSYWGLRDHQVQRTSISATHAAYLLLTRLLALITMATLALPGLILNWGIFVVTRWYSHKKAVEAAKSSSVKIKGRDVIGTWKILVALVIVPTLYFFYAVIVYVYSRRVLEQSRVVAAFQAVLTYIMMPILSYVCLQFGEKGMDIYRSLRPLSLRLIPFAHSRVDDLRTMRAQLADDITALIDELGPELYPDWSTRMFRSASHDSIPIIQGAEDESRALSGASTPGLQSLRGWIKNPIELLDYTRLFDWEQVSETDQDDVFFFSSEDKEKQRAKRLEAIQLAQQRDQASSTGIRKQVSGSSLRTRARANCITETGRGSDSNESGGTHPGSSPTFMDGSYLLVPDRKTAMNDKKDK